MVTLESCESLTDRTPMRLCASSTHGQPLPCLHRSRLSPGWGGGGTSKFPRSAGDRAGAKPWMFCRRSWLTWSRRCSGPPQRQLRGLQDVTCFPPGPVCRGCVEGEWNGFFSPSFQFASSPPLAFLNLVCVLLLLCYCQQSTWLVSYLSLLCSSVCLALCTCPCIYVCYLLSKTHCGHVYSWKSALIRL